MNTTPTTHTGMATYTALQSMDSAVNKQNQPVSGLSFDEDDCYLPVTEVCSIAVSIAA